MSKYLITFDLDTTKLKTLYHGNSYNNAYYDIRSTLSRRGFDNIQGSVYLGQEGVSEAHGTLAIQELTAKYTWFYECVSNIRFYRIESDLNAQFIADGVNEAKKRFYAQLEDMRKSLLSVGLTADQVNEIIGQQQFKLENVTPSGK
ncbi:VapD [Pantoea ananatis]|uniref:VapD n=1 Tax=Pantoea ananas TaxID=553 RepID=UPI00222246D6|nr:VapD [Pantoea ananatis]MCW1834796.1 VapD [Pantoea ananatis]